MDKSTSVSDLKTIVKDFCDKRNWSAPHSAKDCAIGVVTEGSELLEIFRFVRESDERRVLEERRENIADELADTLYFILRFAEKFGFDLTNALEAKLVKTALKYPAP